MGILLPVMGLVMFPVLVLFMSDVVKPAFIFIGYDILLPVALWFFTNNVLSTKPPTFSQPDISIAKGVPPFGKFRLGKRNLPVLPFAIAAAAPFLFFGLSTMGSADTFTAVNSSLLLVSGVSAAIVVYAMLDSWQKMKVRKEIEQIEGEFSIALFQLGNIISGGAPLEVAVDRAAAALSDMKISELFKIASMNMKKFGYTFEEALFDKEVGAIWYYPSHLVRSIMNTLIESSRKSIKTASESMLTVSQYLKGMHEVKEEIDEILGETISSMKFLAMFLAPMVAGITVTMAVIIIQILVNLGSALGGLVAGQTTGAQSMLLVPWAMGGSVPVSPAGFQLIVGIYMLETAILLAVFLNRIEYGDDEVGMRSTVSTVLLIAVVIYIAAWLVTYSMFGPTLGTLLTPQFK